MLLLLMTPGCITHCVVTTPHYVHVDKMKLFLVLTQVNLLDKYTYPDFNMYRESCHMQQFLKNLKEYTYMLT